MHKLLAGDFNLHQMEVAYNAYDEQGNLVNNDQMTSYAPASHKILSSSTDKSVIA